MPSEISYLSALLVGLLGGVHCVGMCGGIVAALTFGISRNPQSAAAFPRYHYLVLYNLGRIASYTFAGALMGSIGFLASHLTSVHFAQQVLQGIAGLFMIALGLYLGGWWFGLTRVETAGSKFWRFVEPLGRRLLPIQNQGQALLLGILWGWLPCGLVYSVLVWSIASGSATQGALLMLSFAIGTLPTLLTLGITAVQLTRWLRKAWVRRISGGLVTVFGVYTLAHLFLSSGH